MFDSLYEFKDGMKKNDQRGAIPAVSGVISDNLK
jgi:hypothetical protein